MEESKSDKAQVKRAAEALLKHLQVEKSKKQATALIEDEGDRSYFIIYCPTENPEAEQDQAHQDVCLFSIECLGLRGCLTRPIPHSLFRSGESEICLICKDPQADTKKRIAEQGIKEVTKVIGVTKLRKKFKPYEAKRLLCSQYELFMADESVLPLLPPLLGKVFFRQKKQPIGVNLNRILLKLQQHATPRTSLCIRPVGANTASCFCLFFFVLFCLYLTMMVINDQLNISNPVESFYHAFL